MKCLDCSAELVSGFSECFSCGASLHPLMQRANSPLHDDARKGGGIITSEFYSRRGEDNNNSNRRRTASPNNAATTITSPTKTRFSNYASTDYASGVVTGSAVWSPEADKFPWRQERAFSVVTSSRNEEQEQEQDENNQQQQRARMKRVVQQGSSYSPAAARINSSATAGRIAELERELEDYRARDRGMTAFGMSTTSAAGVLAGGGASSLVPNANSTNPVLNDNVNAALLDSADRFLMRTTTTTTSPTAATAKTMHSHQNKMPQQSQHHAVVDAPPPPSPASSSPATQQQQQQQVASPSSSVVVDHLESALPFPAHAAAFMVEAYARNVHGHMLEHRDDLLRLLNKSLRERVAFGKATEEIREAETFAAKAEAVRSVETSKVMQENADLRFQLEEALRAVDQQRDITAAVSRELADVRAQHETSMLAYQSIGSPSQKFGGLSSPGGE